MGSRNSHLGWNAEAEISREAAQEYSPRRKPWVSSATCPSPEGAKEEFAHRLSRSPVRATIIFITALVLSMGALGQAPAAPANLHGLIRDSAGKPIAQSTIVLKRIDSSADFHAQTDAQGSYTFPNVPEGIYTLQATKEGYAEAQVPSVFLKPSESKTIDLTLGLQQRQAGPASSPQFFDEPQFTVAGVTDTTNLGGHGSDTVVRARNSLAKDTASLGESARGAAVDEAREKSLREAAERQPSDFAANHAFGQFLVTTGKAREAIPFLERAAATDPPNYENAYSLALANAQAGNYATARDQAGKLLARTESGDLYHLLGEVDEKLGDSLDAVRHYQRAAELAPSEPHLFDWGAELLLHHAPEPAIEVFSRGNHLFPSSTRILLGLGAAYFARGAYDEAVLRICQSSDLIPNDPVPYQFLGKIEQVQNTPSTELVERLRRFVTLQPRNADANYYYAVGLWKLRNTRPENSSVAEVESLLKTAIQISPKHAAAELQLGILHSDQGAYAEAIADFQEALESDPQMEEAHYRLAHAYRQIGESDKAKEELRLYAQLATQSAQQQDRERHEIKQFVYTLRDQSTPHAQ